MEKKLTYRDAGVDIDAGNYSVSLIKDSVKATYRPEVLGDLGGFGGLFALNSGKYQEPVLVSGTDGVGTKLRIAFMQEAGQDQIPGLLLWQLQPFGDDTCQNGYPQGVIVHIAGQMIQLIQIVHHTAFLHHGGNDAGAVGPTGVMEKSITLRVAKAVQQLLTAAGAQVLMTRTTDTEVSAKHAGSPARCGGLRGADG